MDIKQLNERMFSFVNDELVAGIREVLEQLPYKAICLCDNDNIPISAYHYDGFGNLAETRVMALVLYNDGTIAAYEDASFVGYQFADIMDEDKIDEDRFFNLDTTNCGDYLAMYTIIEIVERIGDYLEPKNYMFPNEINNNNYEK